MTGMLFLVTYRTHREVDGELEQVEEVAEVRAFSREQACFLAPCAPDSILNIECVVAKHRGAGEGR